MTLYPDIALAFLRQGLVASGRLWLLLRFLDTAGQGWLSEAEARRSLTGSKAPWRLCGPRQLRNLLTQGENLFWIRQGDRLWLRSVARVALSLGITKLHTTAVHLPVSILTGRIGSVRAHFYASFHSSRNAVSPTGRQRAKPIARLTLEKMAHITRQTQRRYEAAAGVRRQANVAVGAPLSATAVEGRAQQHGHALFHFTDAQGRLGAAGQTYVAWQLPNSYLGPHQRKTRQQRRRLNRQLAGLLQKGMTGNGKKEPRGQLDRLDRRFHRDGRQAARAYTQHPAQDAYWPEQRGHRGTRIWHLLPADTPFHTGETLRAGKERK